MVSKAGKIIRAIAPIAISFAAPYLAPALGITSALGTTALGAGLGAASGGLTGGGIKGALTGALAGGLGAGGGDYLAGSSGLGLTGAGASALSKGLTGAATGFNSTGKLSGALIGGAVGGLGGYAQGGGFDGAIDSIKGALGIGDTANSVNLDPSGYFGGGASTTGTLQSGGDLAAAGSSGVNLDPSGYFSDASPAVAGGGASSFGSAASAGSGGSSFLSGNTLSNLLSGGINAYSQDKATDQLVDSQKSSLDALSPFLQNGQGASDALATRLGTNGNTGDANYGDLTKSFSPDDLQNEPGYKFNLEQGTNALNNTLAAAGGLQSGNAIKAGQQFSQGLADTTYGNAFARDNTNKLTTAGLLNSAVTPGLGAAGATADVNNNIGTAKSKGTQGMSNTVTSTLANLLSGSGAKTVIGYKPDGTPIYAT